MQFYNQTDNILSYEKILNLKKIVKDKLQLDFANYQFSAILCHHAIRNHSSD